MAKIRVLSVRQPYADDIIYGTKWQELRSRATPYRGDIYIHASRWASGGDRESPGPGEIGAIIGRVTLVDCLADIDLRTVGAYLFKGKRLPTAYEPLAKYLKSLPEHSWRESSAPVHWLVFDPRPLVKPVKMLGKLNLWNAKIDGRSLKCGPCVARPKRPDPAKYPFVD